MNECVKWIKKSLQGRVLSPDQRQHLSDRMQPMLQRVPRTALEISLPSSRRSLQAWRCPPRPCWSSPSFTWVSSCCYISSGKSSRQLAPQVMLARKTSEEESEASGGWGCCGSLGRQDCRQQWQPAEGVATARGTYHHNSGTVTNENRTKCLWIKKECSSRPHSSCLASLKEFGWWLKKRH